MQHDSEPAKSPTPLVTAAVLLCIVGHGLAGLRVTYDVTRSDTRQSTTVQETAAYDGAYFRWTSEDMVSVRNLENESYWTWRPASRFFGSASIPARLLSSYLRKYDKLSGGAYTAAQKRKSDEEAMRALSTIIGLGVNASSGDWVGAVTSLLGSTSQDVATAAQQSVRGIVDLHVEMSNDGKPVCGRPTSLLKVYGPEDITLESFRVVRVGAGMLSAAQLTKLAGRIGGPSAEGNSLEAWRAFLTDGYVWLWQDDLAEGSKFRATNVEDSVAFPETYFDVPDGRIAYDGKGNISVGEWKYWRVDGIEVKVNALEQAVATSGQRIRGGLTLKCSGGNRAARLLIKLKYLVSEQELKDERIDRTIEITDGETEDYWVEWVLPKARSACEGQLYIEVSIDGQVISSSPSDYRIICRFTS